MRPWLAGVLLALAWPAAAAPTVELLVQTSPLAGFQYHAGRALWPLMRVGDPLVLVREPWNPHDAEAIRVEWRGAMIGFASMYILYETSNVLHRYRTDQYVAAALALFAAVALLFWYILRLLMELQRR